MQFAEAAKDSRCVRASPSGPTRSIETKAEDQQEPHCLGVGTESSLPAPFTSSRRGNRSANTNVLPSDLKLWCRIERSGARSWTQRLPSSVPGPARTHCRCGQRFFTHSCVPKRASFHDHDDGVVVPNSQAQQTSRKQVSHKLNPRPFTTVCILLKTSSSLPLPLSQSRCVESLSKQTTCGKHFLICSCGKRQVPVEYANPRVLVSRFKMRTASMRGKPTKTTTLTRIRTSNCTRSPSHGWKAEAKALEEPRVQRHNAYATQRSLRWARRVPHFRSRCVARGRLDAEKPSPGAVPSPIRPCSGFSRHVCKTPFFAQDPVHRDTVSSSRYDFLRSPN